ncbi:prolyl oligopeptidase family serine peptidase [Streptomyces sp. NPDC005438]|uniref:alpha/beta hydrolase family protein n=1 Tax=Streptomyces sp. NPDC005438 TaxID=3156880 RepID=UPI0033A142B6
MTAAPDRVSFHFSVAAEHAACLTGTADGGFAAELWTLRGPQADQVLSQVPVTPQAQPVPTDDGRLLILVNGTKRHRISLSDPHRPEGRVLSLNLSARGLRLVAAPSGAGLALALETDHDDQTVLWRVLEKPLRAERALTLPGRTGRVHWLDLAGDRLAIDLRQGPRVVTALVDLRAGTWTPLPHPEGTDTHRVVLADPRSGRLLLATDRGGAPRLGWASAEEPTEPRLPRGLNSVRGAVLPLAFDPTGSRLALRVTRGAVAEAVRYDLATDRISGTELPGGMVYPAACWGEGGLWVAHSRPGVPTRVERVSDQPRRTRPVPSGPGDPRVERFGEGPDDFEAVCLGDWRRSEGVVVALHGGPEAAWTLGHDSLLDRLSRSGLAVVAPNQRGSLGYGQPHARAIHGAWGGPDLADIRALVRQLRAERASRAMAPALYGISYGAFLGLLTVAADPSSWSRCVAVAPFLSARRLYGTAGAQVRALVDRHREGPHAPTPTDEWGERDLWRLSARIRTPLLLVHGADDPTVPVDQSRQLRRRLTDLGRREGTDFDYVEVPDAGHDPLREPGGAALADRVTDFLRARTPAPTG